MKDNKSLGLLGEQLSVRYLEERSYHIIHRNLRIGRFGEMDILAWAPDGITLCVVEVKTRSSDAFGSPGEAVGYQKQKRIRKMTEMWLQSLEKSPVAERIAAATLRFDVAEVRVDKDTKTARVHLIEGAF